MTDKYPVREESLTDEHEQDEIPPVYGDKGDVDDSPAKGKDKPVLFLKKPTK